jgi:hypothetical protein
VPGKEYLNVAASLDVVSAQTGQILCDNAADFPGFNVGNHALKTGAVEVPTSIAVIDVVFTVEKTVFVGVVLQHQLLVADAHALIVTSIFQRKAAVESGNLVVCLLFPVHFEVSSNKQGHDTDMIPQLTGFFNPSPGPFCKPLLKLLAGQALSNLLKCLLHSLSADVFSADDKLYLLFCHRHTSMK